MPVPTSESTLEVSTTNSQTYENLSNASSSDPNLNCYSNYGAGMVQDMHPTSENICVIHVYPGATFSIRNNDGTYETITGPVSVPMYTPNGAVPVIACPPNCVQQVVEENGVKHISFVPNTAAPILQPANTFIAPQTMHQHHSPNLPLPNSPHGQLPPDYFTATQMIPNCQPDSSASYHTPGMYQSKPAESKGALGWMRKSGASVSSPGPGQLAITSSGIDVKEEEIEIPSARPSLLSSSSLTLRKSASNNTAGAFNKSAFHSPSRTPSNPLGLNLPLAVESEDGYSFMKRLRSGSKALPAVSSDLFGSGFNSWSAVEMSESPMNSTPHHNSQTAAQSTSGDHRRLSDAGDRASRREKRASNDSLPDAASSMKSSPASSLTSSPRLSPRTARNEVHSNGYKGPKSPARSSPRSQSRRQVAPAHFHPQSTHDFNRRSPKAQPRVSSTSPDKSSLVTDPDLSSDYSTASEYRSFETVEEFLGTVHKPEVIKVETRKATITWNSLPLENVAPDIREAFQRHALQYNLLLARLQSKKNAEGKYETRYRGTQLKYELKDLKPGTDYFVKISASCDNLLGRASESTSFRTKTSPPDIPSAPKLGQATKNSLQLRWVAPSDNGEKIFKYHLEYDQAKTRTKFQLIYEGISKQYRLTDLVPSRAYVFRLSAENKLGQSAWSPEIVFYTAGVVPSIPDPPVLADSSSRTLTLSWSKNPAEEDVSSYVLEMNDESKNYGFLTLYNGSDLQCTAKNLQRSYSYKFRLRAVNSYGHSNFSKVATYSTSANKPKPPGIPRIKGNVHARALTLQWDPTTDDGGADIENYKLFMSRAKKNSMVEVYTGIDREFTVNNLDPGHTYRFHVTCSTLSGMSPTSEEAQFKTNPVLPGQCPPPMLAMRPKSSCITVKWGPPSATGGSEITKYEANYMMKSGDCLHPGYSGSATECTIFNLLPGSCYTVGVRAANTVGFGPWSDRLEVTTCAGVPEKPEAPEVSTRSSSCINVIWKVPADNGAPITSYKLRWGSAHDSMTSQVVKSSILSHELTSLLPHTIYYISVQAINSAGTSNPSDVTSASTFAAIPDRVSNLHAALPPSSPDDVDDERTSAVTSHHVTIMWDVPRDNGSKIVDYKIQMRPLTSSKSSDSLASSSEMLTVDGDKNFADIYDLTPDTEYKFKVHASNLIGAGLNSSPLVIRTKPLPPETPILTCSNKLYNSLKLEWAVENSTPSTQYHLQLRDKNGRFTTLYRGTNTSFRASRLSEESLYKFRVSAINSAGPGPYSEECRFETDVQSPPAVEAPTVSDVSANKCKVTWTKVNRMRGDCIVYRVKLEKSSSAHPPAEFECETNNCLIGSLSPDVKYRLRVRAVRLHPLPHQESPDFQAIREVCGPSSSVTTFQTLSGSVLPHGVPVLTALSEPTPVVEDVKPERFTAEPGENLQKSSISKTELIAVSDNLGRDSSQAFRVIACYLVSAIFLAYVLSFFCI